MTDNIKHIVYLLLENQSFDRMLGCFQEVYPELDGVLPTAEPRSNPDPQAGSLCKQLPTTTKQVNPDPKHEVRYVLDQLKNGNQGFVSDFVANYPGSTTAQRKEIMGYYPRSFLPALHTLASEYTICDHWFSSLPGPTWPNRFFALTGTANGQALMPEGIDDPQLEVFFNQTQPTIFDRLNEKNISWKVYYYDFPSSLLLEHQRELKNLLRYHHIDEYYDDCQDEATFPNFSFIEPKYYGADQNDDHPPHNVFKGEKLIADIYNGIRSNPALWESTLLVITYDEHGGFYDHVIPGAAEPPDDRIAKIDPKNPAATFSFDRFGVRVPALLVSPWVAKRVESTIFDHTSLLRYLIEKWNLGPLGKRTTSSSSLVPSIAVALRGERNESSTAFIRVPYTDLIPPDPGLERQDPSEHQRALQAFAYHLARNTGDQGIAQKLAGTAGPWMRLKAVLGSGMLSLGARLTRDLQQFNESKFDSANGFMREMIRKAQAQQPGNH